MIMEINRSILFSVLVLLAFGICTDSYSATIGNTSDPVKCIKKTVTGEPCIAYDPARRNMPGYLESLCKSVQQEFPGDYCEPKGKCDATAVDEMACFERTSTCGTKDDFMKPGASHVNYVGWIRKSHKQPSETHIIDGEPMFDKCVERENIGSLSGSSGVPNLI
jgi:hypothetical protein